MERRVVKAFKPVLARASGVPMPHDSVFDAIERLHRELEEVHSILTGPESSVRLVLTPESVVVAEARRSLTTLSLFGYRVDGVVANRVFPEAGSDDWRRQWVEAQQEILDEVDQSFGESPIWRSLYRAREPIGVAELAAFASALYRDSDPLAPPAEEGPIVIRRTATGAMLTVALPFVAKDEVDLARRGDELVVTVGSFRRMFALPAALSRQSVAGARIENGALNIRFTEPGATA
jgi:arsenite-transporting ATPase